MRANTDPGCPICGTSGHLVLDGGRDYYVAAGNSDTFRIEYCSNCEIGYSTPPLTESELQRYYPGDYGPFVGEQQQRVPWLQRAKYLLEIRRLRALVGPGARSLFELGAGSGAFLAEAQNAGFEVAGMEPSEAAREQAHTLYGLDLEPGSADNLTFHRTHDVVVLRHVLEHVNDPLGCLESIHQEGLVPGGHLFIKVPRLDSWEAKFFDRLWSGYELPRHRVHFTARGAAQLLRRAGYVGIVVRQEVVPNDIQRSLDWVARFGEQGWLPRVARWYGKAPHALRMILAQGVGGALIPLRPGRMIIEAQRPQ